MAALGLTTAGCWRLPIFFSESGEAGLEKFASAEAFKAYLAEQVDATGRWQGGWTDMPGGFGMPMMGAAPMAAPDAAEGGGDFSSTNLQEAGVDESDVVKNDATYLYILDADRLDLSNSGGGALRIVRAVPANDMAVVSTVDLPGVPKSLYLKGDTIVALSGADGGGFGGMMIADGYGWGGSPATTVTILDVSDRAAPTVQATLEVEGSLVTSRLIGSKLHLVLSVWPALPEGSGFPSIEAAPFDDLVPDLIVTLADGSQVRRNIVDWRDSYHPIDADGTLMSVVATVDVDDPSAEVRSVAVMANAATVYASPQALYLTDNEYNYAGLIRETTDLYKFDLTDAGAALAAVGSIPGRLLNRYSLGEHAGYLRTATTTGHVARGGGDVTNNVYVLGVEGDELAIVGRVENIAPGEQIYAARFIQERGFLVTFKKVDPLFTLNLADPASPQVVGRLKVEGYSEYIHPLGENHLLTLGKDAVDMGAFAWYQGVQLSVFDVTNFDDPQRVDVEVVGDRGTESEALYEPHAFNYFEPAAMLAVPMNVLEGAGPDPSSFGHPAFVGLCLYRVTPGAGIEPAAQISTGTAAAWPFYGFDWTRGVFIDDHVYAVTPSDVQSLPLSDLGATPRRLPLN